ncbi:unnamed protein product, partial [Vitis vinifera]|uniref:Extradiol ring-cleavage dioxygenase class III enzyme subunit B domain-containing protein n=1 Tax=Vitis vinifera TaxID=29760 RepID=D7T246_VITVI
MYFIVLLVPQTTKEGLRTKFGLMLGMGRGQVGLEGFKKGVLIIGSGSAPHNLRALNPNSESVVPWAYDQFDTWLKGKKLSLMEDMKT